MAFLPPSWFSFLSAGPITPGTSPPSLSTHPPQHSGLTLSPVAPAMANLNYTMQAPRPPSPKDWSPRGREGMILEPW